MTELELTFEDIKNAVRNDIRAAEGTDKEGLLCIEQETADAVFLYDDMDGMNRTYSIADPAAINAGWIADRVIVTDSVRDACRIDTEILAEWLAQHTDKNLLLTLESIVFINDSDADYDFLCENYGEKFEDALQENQLPDGDVLGIMWHSEQAVLVNAGAILHETDKEIADGLLNAWERESCTSYETMKTLLHEIRHLAQENPYLPEEILNQHGTDEQDAEEYAEDACSGGIPHFLSICIQPELDEEDFSL